MSNEPEVSTVEVPTPFIEILPNTTEETVTMSKKALNELIVSRMGRAGSEARERAAELEKENTRLKEIAAGSAPDSTELEKTRAELSAQRMLNDQIQATNLRQAKDAFIISQAQRQHFLDADVIVKLTRDNLKWDEGTKVFTVLDDSGQPRTAPDGSPLTPEQFFEGYASDRNYMVAGQVRSGGGGTSSSGSRSPVTEDWRRYFGKDTAQAANASKIARQDPEQYKQLQEEGRALGLLPPVKIPRCLQD